MLRWTRLVSVTPRQFLPEQVLATMGLLKMKIDLQLALPHSATVVTSTINRCGCEIRVVAA